MPRCLLPHAFFSSNSTPQDMLPSAQPDPSTPVAAKTQPRGVSILIAAHNRCELLARTLESLAAIDRPRDAASGTQLPIECIVIANACTDDTEGVVSRAAASGTFPFALRVINEPRRGVSHARNRAVEESRHDLCIFIDSDCLADAGWLVEHVRAYREHNADLVTGRIELWWEEVAEVEGLSYSMREALGEHRHSDEPQRLAEPRAYAANLSFRREVFHEAGPFRTDIGRAGTGRLAHEEMVFARRAMQHGRAFWWTPHAMVRHWVPVSSITDDFFTRSAYWGSVSFMLTTEPMTASIAASTLLKSPLRLLTSLSTLVFARLRADPSLASVARMDLHGALGRLRGLWTRLTGLHVPKP